MYWQLINIVFRTMLRYLKEIEEAINTGVEHMKESDRFNLDSFNAFRVIVSACRAIVLSQLGFKAQVSEITFFFFLLQILVAPDLTLFEINRLSTRYLWLLTALRSKYVCL